MKPLFMCITTLITLASTINLTGRWESPLSVKGNVTGVVFKTDNTFEGYVNKKPFVSGTYTFSAEDSMLTMQDGGCAGITAIYKVNFFSNGDSMRFTAINDSCIQRKEGMQRLVMGKVKR
jgi:hypothetical protein